MISHVHDYDCDFTSFINWAYGNEGNGKGESTEAESTLYTAFMFAFAFKFTFTFARHVHVYMYVRLCEWYAHAPKRSNADDDACFSA